MKEISRRELLRRLAAGSALATLPSLVRAASALQQTRTAEAPFQRVNVLFHGLSLIEFSDDEIHVFLPNAGSDRAYLAGTWMQEVALGRGQQYRFSGVMTGPRPEFYRIDPKQNAVFRNGPMEGSLAFCKLVFPFPDVVTPLRLLRKSHGKNFFTGEPKPIVEPEVVPQILAFSYVHPDTSSPLQFRPLPWTPVVYGGVVNLHIWDSAVKTPTPQASQSAFASMAKMMGAPSLGLDPAYDAIKPPRPDEKPEVVGLGCEQEWSLSERMSEPEGCGKEHKYKPKDDSGLDSLPIILF
ncbi:MAG: hypothetical protein KGL59_05685 [Acidobacteriota bacterium]|nr:hypothetical protein [Acidobacteriota bacterium]